MIPHLRVVGWVAALVCLLAIPASAQQVLTPGTWVAPLGSTCTPIPGGHSCVVPPTVEPPVTAMVTIVKAGPGTGTVVSASPSGVQPGINCGSDCTETVPGGTAMSLSASAAVGSIFTGWSGDGCTGIGVCALSVNGPKTITAMFDVSLPPTTGGGTWTKFFDGLTQPINADPWSYGFAYYAIDTKRKRLTAHWPVGTNRYCSWDLSGTLAAPFLGCVVDVTSGQTPGGSAHNESGHYDPIGDKIYHSAFAPGLSGAYGWDPVTQKSFRFGNTPPAQINAGMCYDSVGNQIFAWGGYSNTDGRIGLLNLNVTPPTWGSFDPGQPQPKLKTADVPPPSTPMRLTYTRSGCDRTTNLGWMIDDNGDLWRLNPATKKWYVQTTTGVKPSVHSAYAFDALSRVFVGWAGANLDTGAAIRKTAILDEATRIWVEGPSGATGTPTLADIKSMAGFTHPVTGRPCFSIGTGPLFLWCFTPASGPPPPPPPPQTSLLTVTQDGDGTLAAPLPPGGRYPVGGDVILAQPIPAPGSSFIRWTPSDCPQFKMPATPKTCTATVTKNTVTPPPPPPPATPTDYPADYKAITRGVFHAFRPPSTTQGGTDQNPCPPGGGCKHQRWATNGQGKSRTGFGDTNPSKYGGNPSQNQGYEFEFATGKFSRWNPPCRPAGQIQPRYPDEVVWAYDQRGQYHMLCGVCQQGPQFCSEDGGGAEQFQTGLFTHDVATDRWRRDASAVGTTGEWGVFDNQKKDLIYYGTPGSNTSCNANIHKLNVDTLARASFPICFTTNPFPGTPIGTFEKEGRSEKMSLALDEASRTLYTVSYHDLVANHQDVPGPPRVRAWAINIDTGQKTRLPNPPNDGDPTRKMQDVQTLLWDPVHKVVIYPFVSDHCGVLRGMYTYKPGATAWVSHPLTANPARPANDPIRGNGATIDDTTGTVMLQGSVACSDWEPGKGYVNPITDSFLWKMPLN